MGSAPHNSFLIAAALAALHGAGCARTPDSVPLPPQRRTYAGPPRRPFGSFLRIADPHANRYIVRGIEVSEERRWRWTGRRAEARFWLKEDRPRKLVLNLYIAPRTFRETGPMTVACFVDGRPLGRFRCDAPREFTFEKDVPPGWLSTAGPVTVAMETDKPWRSPGDGAELGFLLIAVGFQPR